MRVLLVAFTATSEAIYKRIAEAIRESGEKWWHFMEPIWLVKTDKTADELGSTLAEVAKEVDGALLVVEVTGRAQGWLPRKSWKWINEHVDPGVTESPQVSFAISDDSPLVIQNEDGRRFLNRELVVHSDKPAVIWPEFLPKVAPVALVPGENRPFSYVSWAVPEGRPEAELRFFVRAAILGSFEGEPSILNPLGG